VDVQALLDPEIAAVLRTMPVNLGDLTLTSLPVVREQRAAMPVPELSDAVLRQDQLVPGPAGEPAVSLRVHRPVNGAGALPCVYWMHGGGYVLGTNALEDARFDRWCQLLGCVGVSVEYRLAPETAYPGPLEDCYAGLKWVYDNAAELGVDPARLGIGGGSAGGGLAAGLALLARDRAEVPLAFQLLIYPMIDDRMVTPSSRWDVPVWPPAANQFGWSAYLGPRFGGDVPVYAAAARATELAGLPPALMIVGALDGFVDEDVDYAVRLNRSGVSTELHLYPGAPHGFDSMALSTSIAQRARRDMEHWLTRMLEG
jgi:acetyl esterase/lipase